jgi:hypothetical protein
VRFREAWTIASDAASFFFAAGATWTSLSEVRLRDKNGGPVGNIDLVLVSYDAAGRLTDFGALEVQAVYISGNVRRPFEYYMQDPVGRQNMQWPGSVRPDFLSSSRKRLAPQLTSKGGIINAWGKKLAVAVDSGFFATLPSLTQVPAAQADLAWFVYSLDLDQQANRYHLVRHETVYTMYAPTLATIAQAEPGPLNVFVSQLQSRLDRVIVGTMPSNSTSPSPPANAPTETPDFPQR